MFINQFTAETGINVRFVRLNANTQEEYITQLNLQMYLNDGPTLVLIAAGESYDAFVNEGIALEVADKLTNYRNVYDRLKDGYYVPIAMAEEGFLFNRILLEELGVKVPYINWTKEEYEEIYLNYDEKNGYFVNIFFWNSISNELVRFMENIKSNQKSQTATSELVTKLHILREEALYSDKYIRNEGYTYENYYNMLFVIGSDEHTEFNQLFHQSRESDPVLFVGTRNIL